MEKYTVYIADDHNIVVSGIATLLRSLNQVNDVLIFKNGKELFDFCSHKQPNIVFLDLDMPIWDGRKTLVELKNKYPNLRCYILSMLNEKYIIEDCILKKANGYLNKDCTINELEEAINTSDEIYYSKEILKVLSGVVSKKPSILSEPLSDRELEILAYLCEGFSPKEIAEKVFLSHRTVETHKTNIMQKFNVNSVGKLISLAIKNKIV